jgi:hypothetical protein
MQTKAETTQERLKELLSYDPETGLFTRLMRAGTARPGDIAGCMTPKGYLIIKIDGEGYMAHRLAWLYVHGKWPADQIDHINGVKNDNRIANLREATNSENMQNQRAASKANRAGLIGVYPNRHRFVAQITINRQKQYLGIFATAEEAHSAYLSAKKIYHPAGTL